MTEQFLIPFPPFIQKPCFRGLEEGLQQNSHPIHSTCALNTVLVTHMQMYTIICFCILLMVFERSICHLGLFGCFDKWSEKAWTKYEVSRSTVL